MNEKTDAEVQAGFTMDYEIEPLAGAKVLYLGDEIFGLSFSLLEDEGVELHGDGYLENPRLRALVVSGLREVASRIERDHGDVQGE
jgi:hypothetical protein